MKFVSRNKSTANIAGDLKEKASALVTHIRTFFKASNNEYRPQGIDTRFDYCATQEGIRSSILNNLIRKAIANYTNVVRRCPLTPGNYYIKDWSIDPRQLPSLIPVGRYLVNLTNYIDNNEFLWYLLLYFNVANYGIQDMSLAGLG